MSFKYIIFALCLNLFFAPLHAGEKLIYQESAEGVDSQFNPLSYYINGSFDTEQNPTYFSQHNYFSNHNLVFQRIKDPAKSIERDGGWSKFFEDEFFSSRAVPNYSLHLVGGGYDFRKLAEWFEVNDYPAPYAFAFTVSLASEFGNEALESSNREVVKSHDHIADLYFFDLAGKALFLNDNVASYMVNTLHLQTWGFQPVYEPNQKRIYNAGNNYVLSPEISDGNIQPFLLMGMQVLLGVKYKDVERKKNYSFSLGPAFTDPLANKSRLATGIFYEKNDHLMSSLLINSTSDLKVRLNLYPGMLNLSSFSPGIFVALNRQNDYLLGLSYYLPLGLGKLF